MEYAILCNRDDIFSSMVAMVIITIAIMIPLAVQDAKRRKRKGKK